MIRLDRGSPPPSPRPAADRDVFDPIRTGRGFPMISLRALLPSSCSHHHHRLGRGCLGRREAPGPATAASPGMIRASSARPTPRSLQGRAGLPRADGPATRAPGPRAGDRSPVHPQPPQALGRARPSCWPSGMIRTPRRPRTLLEIDGLAYGLAFHPDYRRNGYIYIGLRRQGDRPGVAIHGRPAAAASRRPGFEAPDRRVGLRGPRRRRRRLRQRRDALRLDGRRLERLGRRS